MYTKYPIPNVQIIQYIWEQVKYTKKMLYMKNNPILKEDEMVYKLKQNNLYRKA